MQTLEGKQFYPDCGHDDSKLDDYYNKDKTFGHFIDDGKAYVIETRETPRQWLQFLCNDKIRSAVTNTGMGFIFSRKWENITKYWELDYLVRNINGKRELLIGEKRINFFTESENFTTIVHPGYITFYGMVDGFEIEVLMFVPLEIPCECWRVRVKNLLNTERTCRIEATQEWMLGDEDTKPELRVETNKIYAYEGEKKAVFGGTCLHVETESDIEEDTDKVLKRITHVSLVQEFAMNSREEIVWNVVSGVYETVEEETDIINCTNKAIADAEFDKIKEQWNGFYESLNCSLPNKNMEYFLNYWLKNQLYLTYRYDRAAKEIGYRDGLQDSWGYCLVDAKKAKEKLIATLSHMYPDGRCPRQYNWFSDELDARDFSDSPIWAPDSVASYIKETGDIGILNEEIGFYGSAETSTVENHIFRALDYLYHSRGKNRLVLIRGGDWADGLSGINKYGADATSVWITIAAFWAQNIMREIYSYVGQTEKAELMKIRSEEYKAIVNEVGWDGNWFSYGFFEDGEPIGSSKNLEGKIWLNPQTWAIFSGIADSKDKVSRMEKAINRYLLTPFGSMVMYPPYAFHGARCGRVQRQRPGTFLNAAIYNHAASFKVFADIAREDYDDALDTFLRALPNHPDNSDSCRTSEPYCVGNVYYGPNNERYGMNLFSWFTATPAWLIHGGYEQILGVKAGFDGIEITPHVPVDWENYSVNKLYRGTKYEIEFARSSEEKGIWVDGVKIAGNCVKSDKGSCKVLVKF